MKKIELNLWENIFLLIGSKPGSTKTLICDKLNKTYVAIDITVNAMLLKGVIRQEKVGREIQLFIVNKFAYKSLKAFAGAIEK